MLAAATALAALFTLMDEADDALDKDTYEQKLQHSRDCDRDMPADADLTIQVGTGRKINRVFTEIDRLRRDGTDLDSQMLVALREAEVSLTAIIAVLDLPKESPNRKTLELVRNAIAKAAPTSDGH